MSRFQPSPRRLGWIALPLSCLAAAAVAGAFWEPPSEDNSTVGVWAHNPKQLEQAGVPHFGPPPLEGATFFTNPNSKADDAAVKATRADEESALSVARQQAIRYVESLTARQDRWLREALRQGGDPAAQRARRSALAAPARYELRYETPSTGAGEASAPLRGALIGLLVSGLVATSMLVARRRDPGSRPSDGGDPASALAAIVPPAAIAAGVLVSAGLVALSSVAASGVYTFLFIALTFTAAFLYALQGGPAAIRDLLIAVIALAPLRGVLLALADTIDLSDALLTFNAIQPSLIAGGAAAALLAHRSMFRDQPPLLIACWVAIAVVALLDFATQSAGAEALRDRAGPVPRLPHPRAARLAVGGGAGPRAARLGVRRAGGSGRGVDLPPGGGRGVRRSRSERPPPRWGNRQLPARRDLPRHDLGARARRAVRALVVAKRAADGGRGRGDGGGDEPHIQPRRVWDRRRRRAGPAGRAGRQPPSAGGCGDRRDRAGPGLELGARPGRGSDRLPDGRGRLGRGRSGQRKANPGDERDDQRVPGAPGRTEGLREGPRVHRATPGSSPPRNRTRRRAIR